MWDVPVPVKRLVLAPAERADVIADFSGLAGQTLVLKNHNPSKPVVSPAPSLEQVMQTGWAPASPTEGRAPSLRASPAARQTCMTRSTTRYITLNEIDIDEPTWFLNLNGVHFDAGPTTETPKVGTVEDWVFVNLTGDTHPMHMHLVTFKVVGRTPFDVEAYEEGNEGLYGVPGGIDPTPFATGPMLPPAPDERGFKDTVKVNPGYFTTIRAKFDSPQGLRHRKRYVYHCHIVEHEDNDMMRPYHGENPDFVAPRATVREGRLELPRPLGHRILSPARLPVPPLSLWREGRRARRSLVPPAIHVAQLWGN